MQMLAGLLLTGLLVIFTLQATLTGQSSARQPLATVDGVAIGREDVDKLVGSALWPLEDRLYRIQEQAIEALIKQRLLETEAARRKISLQALIDAEVTARAGSVTDEEIDRAKASMGQSSREEIRKALLKEKVGAALSRFVSTLERKSKRSCLSRAAARPALHSRRQAVACSKAPTVRQSPLSSSRTFTAHTVATRKPWFGRCSRGTPSASFTGTCRLTGSTRTRGRRTRPPGALRRRGSSGPIETICSSPGRPRVVADLKTVARSASLDTGRLRCLRGFRKGSCRGRRRHRRRETSRSHGHAYVFCERPGAPGPGDARRVHCCRSERAPA